MRYVAMPEREVIAVLAKLNAEKLTLRKQINALDSQIKNSELGTQVKNKISLQKKLLEESLRKIEQDINLRKY